MPSSSGETAAKMEGVVELVVVVAVARWLEPLGCCLLVRETGV